MKYTAVLVVGILILTGAGCSNKPASTPAENTANNTPASSQQTNTSGDENSLEAKSAVAGFHIYAPTFAPADAPIEGDVAYIENKAAWLLTKDSFNTELPLITIEENPAGASGGVNEKLLPNLTSQEMVTVNEANGYYGIRTGVYNYNTVIFTTTDGVEIAIWSRTYGKDVLMQVARGMK